MLLGLMIVTDIERLERHVAEQFARRCVDHYHAKASRVAAPARDRKVAGEVGTIFRLNLDGLAGTLIRVGQLAAAKLRRRCFAAVACANRVVVKGRQAIDLRVERGEADKKRQDSQAHGSLKLS